MRRKIVVAVLLLLLLLFIARAIIAPHKGTISYSLEGKNYMLITANTPHQWEQGLMNRRKLENADGMIFIFPDKKIRSFWNENTFLDLDVYWLDDDIVVGKSFLPSIEKQGSKTVFSPRPVNIVIELVQ